MYKDVNRPDKRTRTAELKSTYWGALEFLKTVQSCAKFHIGGKHLFIHNSYYVM